MAGLTFNLDSTWYGSTYDVIAYNDNAESDDCTYEVRASFVRFEDARAFVESEDNAHVGFVGIRPPHAEFVRTVRWLAATV
jgi:hypothetical protein